MPSPSSENDLKRRARRRLIGAVVLTLLAVTVLPLLLEDKPPPASPLAVHMAAPPEPVSLPDGAIVPEPSPLPSPVQALAQPGPAAPATRPEPAATAEPIQAVPEKSVSAVPAPKPAVAPASPVVSGKAYVVQLGALSDPAGAEALKARSTLAGFTTHTDKVDGLTRVRVGPYSSREEAETAMKKLVDKGLPAGQVVAQ